jgi:DNA primase
MARDAVAEVRERTDIVELIQSYVPLKKAGRSYKGLCPFHQEKTPSFVVFPESQTFRCFGCGKGGDALTFYQSIEGVDFREALQELARRAGVQLGTTAPRDPEQDRRKQRLIEINELAASFFRHVLHNTEAGEPGRQLVAERGLNTAMLQRFRIGFAPDRWDALLRHLQARGVEPAEALEAGVLSKSEDGRIHDRFRNRLMFPIADRDGNIVGFGARALGAAQPKYLNSPQTDIFDKSRLLYGLDLAKDSIREAGAVVVVEGYMDAITAHQFGHQNVVAAMGTALTEAQIAQVKRFAPKIILALDADAAGQLATVRGVETASDALDHEDVAVTIGPGMIAWQQRLKTEIRIAMLPVGKDPDELLRREPERWNDVIANAQPVLDWLIEAIATSADLSSAAGKSAAVQRMLPLLRQVPDRIQLHHYAGVIARRLGTVPEAVLEELTRRRGAPHSARSQPQPGSPTSGSRSQPTSPRAISRPTHRTEDYLIGLLIAYRDHLDSVTGQVSPDLLEDARNQEILRLLQSPESEGLSGERFTCALDDELADHAEGAMALVTGDADNEDPIIADASRRRVPLPKRYPGQLRREALDALEHLRRERFSFYMRQLQDSLRAAQREGDTAALAELQRQITELTTTIREFDPPPSPVFKDSRSPRAS